MGGATFVTAQRVLVGVFDSVVMGPFTDPWLPKVNFKKRDSFVRDYCSARATEVIIRLLDFTLRASANKAGTA